MAAYVASVLNLLILTTSQKQWPTTNAITTTMADTTTTSTLPTSEVTMDVTPSAMYEDYTEAMTLNCSFLAQPGSDFVALISLILSKTKAESSQTFQEIAAITSVVSRDTVSVKDALGADHVAGQLYVGQRSFISYTWEYPGHEVKGQYRCDAHGVDAFGHPVVASAEDAVTEKPIDHDALLQKIKELDIALNQQKTDVAAELQDKQRQLDEKQSQLDAHKSKMDAQQFQLQDVTTRLNESRLAIMEFSSKYGGHSYYISRDGMWSSVPTFDSLCRLYGGYLLEIDNAQELEFVRNFIKNSNVTTTHIFIGGNDRNQEGKWMFERSGEPMKYFHWGGPTNGNPQDCMDLHGTYDYLMNDKECYAQRFDRFICELPF